MSKKEKVGKQASPQNSGGLLSIILISLAVVFVIIGMYEIMTLGASNGYWAVMIAMACFFGYYIRKNPGKR